MAGTTGYGFPYPTSTDLVRNGASAIQSLASSIDTFIQGSAGASSLFNVTDTFVSTSSTVTATSTGFNIPTNPNSTTFTTGKSGLFVVIVQARLTANGAANTIAVSPDITGAVTSSANILRAAIVGGTNAVTAQWIGVFDGTPSTSTTINLQAWNSAAGNGTVTWSRCTVLTLG